jgi:sulfur carrier protein
VNRLEVVLNGNIEKLNEEMNLSEFVVSKCLNPDTIIVEHNENIVKKQEWTSVILRDKDRLEILNFVGGG